MSGFFATAHTLTYIFLGKQSYRGLPRPFGLHQQRELVSSDLAKLPPNWQQVESALAQLHGTARELGMFLDRQWEELERLRSELNEQARELARRERELERRQAELARGHLPQERLSVG